MCPCSNHATHKSTHPILCIFSEIFYKPYLNPFLGWTNVCNHQLIYENEMKDENCCILLLQHTNQLNETIQLIRVGSAIHSSFCHRLFNGIKARSSTTTRNCDAILKWLNKAITCCLWQFYHWYAIEFNKKIKIVYFHRDSDILEWIYWAVKSFKLKIKADFNSLYILNVFFEVRFLCDRRCCLSSTVSLYAYLLHTHITCIWITCCNLYTWKRDYLRRT